MIHRPPQTTFVAQFERVVFECEVWGSPEPVITWFKDDVEITGATQTALTIDEADLIDRAKYHCTASNLLGTVKSEEAFLGITGYLLMSENAAWIFMLLDLCIYYRSDSINLKHYPSSILS